MKVRELTGGNLISINDCRFRRELQNILTVSPETGRAYRIETELGRYWVWVRPQECALVNAVVYELGEATNTFIFNNGAMVYDDELTRMLLSLSGATLVTN